MNVEVYNLDSLRKLVRVLQKENNELRELLDKSKIPYSRIDIFSTSLAESEDYDPDQGARIIEQKIDRNIANRFFSMFWGRNDVFAKRAKNGRYYPQCNNRWDKRKCPKNKGVKIICDDCNNKNWTKLTPEILINHLIGYSEDGTDVIGVYPLFPDGTCRFIVFDFDNHEKDSEKTDFANKDNHWIDEVNALRIICKQNGIDALVERSRSGRGAHVWILFKKAISADIARDFGFLLLEKGATTINLKSFKYYDRMYPSQDVSDSIGNLIALPLQGQALLKGNTAFVDENWNAYPNQWERLFQTEKISPDVVNQCIAQWRIELPGQQRVADSYKSDTRLKPWKRIKSFNPSDVVGTISIVLSDGIYIDTLNLAPRLQNQIRGMAAMDNPIFHKNKRLGYSNYYNFRTIYMGEDIEGYIKIPRGLIDNIVDECKKSKIEYSIVNERENGRRIRVSFQGELKAQQNLAAQQLLAYDTGILSAATAFGKTVVCSYLIAERKVNTLILLEKTDLVSQWEDEISRFLVIDEKLPEYQTKTGRTKKRASVVGTLYGGVDKLTGIVDIAMIGSLYKKGSFNERLNSYGMVIMDECHHAASATAQEILKRVNAKYLYGVSATPIRSDNLERINYMLLGPIRHKYTALERTTEQNIDHFVIPRYTRVVGIGAGNTDINEAYMLISKSKVRNDQIIDDIRESIKQNRTPVILTKYKEHAKLIYENVKDDADYVFLLYGDNTDKENEEIRISLKEVPKNKSVILVATGQKIGEGFDYPRLDTLMLASPVSFSGRLEQYVGRLNRDYEGKEKVVVYDYIDSHIPVFNNMYQKRIRAYKKIGFNIVPDIITSKQDVNAIYDSGNYTDVFEQDMIEAENEIVISSPGIISQKIERLVYLLKPRQEAGVKITVITENPEGTMFGNTAFLYSLVEQMKSAGFNVVCSDDEIECYAVIDRLIVWHGGMNLLGKEDTWDNLIRVKDIKAAAELLIMSFGNNDVTEV